MKKVILPLALGVTLLGIGLTNQTTSFAQGKTSPKIVQTAKNSAPAFKLKNKKAKQSVCPPIRGKKFISMFGQLGADLACEKFQI